ncbi:MAG: hypothetical protein KDD35_08330, partial [Bdellovibrionales bacterium]|nr:hypothetical protein [Bdellovibrionales bacterium]
QLELQNQAVKKAQEALLRTTRLAAVGEIAGRAAHEVLNPLTGIMSRIQKIQLRLQNHQGDESAVLKEILAAWSEEYKAGGFDGLLDSWKKKSQLNSEWSLFEEDLENIKAVGDSLTGEMGYLSRDIEFLLKECQRINRIVQSMRSLSVVKGDSKPHSVKNLVRESVHIMADLASQMDAEIRIMNFDNEYTVMVDEDEFIQSMTNILRNALQATKAQGLQKERKEYHGIVEVFVNEQPEKVAIHVKDNGVGIEAKYRSKLFETQFSTKPRDEGTGLGLNISRRFIRAFGGDIFLLQSEQNMGTEFVIELPLEKRTSTEKVSA